MVLLHQITLCLHLNRQTFYFNKTTDMDLPKSFNPAIGMFYKLIGPEIKSTRNSPGFSRYSYGNQSKYRSVWHKYNNAIITVGNRYDDIIIPVSRWTSIIVSIIGAIFLAILLISLDTFIHNIILRFLFTCFSSALLIWGSQEIFEGALFFIFKSFRLNLWTGWALIFALVLPA